MTNTIINISRKCFFSVKFIFLLYPSSAISQENLHNIFAFSLLNVHCLHFLADHLCLEWLWRNGSGIFPVHKVKLF